MDKLNELFVNSINKALTSADVMSDINQKPMAYAQIATALAIYLKGGEVPVVQPTPIQVEEPIAPQEEIDAVEESVVEEQESTIEEELMTLQELNQDASTAINEAIEEVNTAIENANEEIIADNWTLPFDENGIPYLNDEDFGIPERVLAYQTAMTPEMKAKRREVDIAKGQAIMNEDVNIPAEEITQAPVEEPATIDHQTPFDEPIPEELAAQIEGLKASMDFYNNPDLLNNLFHNFTSGTISHIDNITAQTVEPFILFVHDELNKAYAKLEEWKNSWITKEGLDWLISWYYQVESATIEEYVGDSNIFWFLECIELYSANQWFDSYKENMNINDLNTFIHQFFDDNTKTIDDINDSNVVGLVYFIQAMS